MRRGVVATGVLAALAASSWPAWGSAGEAPGSTQRIVFARSTAEFDLPEATEIFVMDADGSNEMQLTDNSTEDAFASISPDGMHIAFSRWKGAQYDLFVMDVDGSNARRLTRTKPDEVLAAWSPDGAWLAFNRTFALADGTWQSDIFKLRLADGRLRRITDTGRIKEFAPDWSPDGSAIAFTKQNDARSKYGIAISGPNGADAAWLVINPLSGSGYTDVNPTWSRDSAWVAFSRDHGDDPFVDIYKVRRDGSEVTAVTELSELAENPDWGADGRILFMHEEGIAVVPGDGGTVEHITPTRTGLPYWWPDW